VKPNQQKPDLYRSTQNSIVIAHATPALCEKIRFFSADSFHSSQITAIFINDDQEMASETGPHSIA